MLDIKKQIALILGSECPIGTIAKSTLKSKNYTIIKHGCKKRNIKNYYQIDLTNYKEIEKNINKFKEIDTLVSCVGGNKGFGNKHKLEEKDIDLIFEINLLGNIKFCSCALENTNVKNIILFGSGVVGKYFDNCNLLHYSCAKSALHEYVFQISNIYKNIKINCISPHPKEQMLHNNLSQNETTEKIRKKILQIIKEDITGNIFFI